MQLGISDSTVFTPLFISFPVAVSSKTRGQYYIAMSIHQTLSSLPPCFSIFFHLSYPPFLILSLDIFFPQSLSFLHPFLLIPRRSFLSLLHLPSVHSFQPPFLLTSSNRG